MYKVTSRGTEKQGRESNFKDMETIDDIFAEAAGLGSENLDKRNGRWVETPAPHLRNANFRQ